MAAALEAVASELGLAAGPGTTASMTSTGSNEAEPHPSTDPEAATVLRGQVPGAESAAGGRERWHLRRWC